MGYLHAGIQQAFHWYHTDDMSAETSAIIGPSPSNKVFRYWLLFNISLYPYILGSRSPTVIHVYARHFYKFYNFDLTRDSIVKVLH